MQGEREEDKGVNGQKVEKDKKKKIKIETFDEN